MTLLRLISDLAKGTIVYPTPLSKAESTAIKKILIVRCDSLGDGILSLPALASLKQQRPDIEVHVLTSSIIGNILELTNYVDNIILEPNMLLRQHKQLPRHLIRQPQRLKKLADWYRNYRQLVAEIKSYNFDVAIAIALQRSIAVLLKDAQIPHVFGHYHGLGGLIWRRQIHDRKYLKFSQLNEYDRVLGSLRWLGLKNTYVKPHINLSGIAPPSVIGDWLSGNHSYIVIQPLKLSTSSLIWPIQNFVALTKELLNEGQRVILIGSKSEEPVVRKAFQELQYHSHLRTEFSMSITELCVLINKANLFVGNSSGPLHLASLVETPHVGINQLNFRHPFHKWKPLPQAGQPNMDGYILFPKLDYQCGKCSPRHCPHYSCLRYIEPLEVMQAIKQQLQRRASLS